MPSVFIVGAGVVGTALSAWLVRSGVPVLGLHGRRAESLDSAAVDAGVVLARVSTSVGPFPDSITQADVIIIAVRDDRIPEVAERLVKESRLGPHQILLHTSGANASAEMLGVARGHVRALGTFHPLLSFADPRLAIEGLEHMSFGIEGDEEARRVGHELAERLGGHPVDVATEGLALYHAGAVLVSNYVVVLADLAKSLLTKAGVPEEAALPALVPLMSSVVQNLAKVGLPGSLTGPVERGDVSTVERHLGALGECAPALLGLYKILGKETLRIARSKTTLDDDAVAKLEGMFSTSNDH